MPRRLDHRLSLDIDKVSCKGLAYKELEEAIGEQESTVCFRPPPGIAALLRKVPRIRAP